MSSIDFAAAHLAAQRANAAYETLPKSSCAAFDALGDTWIGLYTTDNMQAALTTDKDDQLWLSIAGTRATDFYVDDLFDDVDLSPVQAPGGGAVTVGVLAGMHEMWDWAEGFGQPGESINVCGHSLGAARAHLTPCFAPSAIFRQGAIYSFAAPKFLSAEYYAMHAASLAKMVCALNGNDAWAAWPWFNPVWSGRPQVPHVHLLSDAGLYQMLAPGAKFDPYPPDVLDHDIGRYVARLAACAR